MSEADKNCNGNDPAFPIAGSVVLRGLTKREYIAIQILAGIASVPESAYSTEEASGVAVKCADALLKALRS